MTNSGPSQPLNDRLKIAGDLVVRAQIFFDCWGYYESAETQPAILETMNDYSEFFRFDSHAHFVSMVMYVGSLYDKRRDTITLGRLAKETAALKPSKVSNLPLVALGAAEAKAAKLVLIRHNLFAHRSASISYADAFREADITANEIRTLLSLSFEVVNALLSANDLPEAVPHKLSQSDLMRLLRKLEASIPASSDSAGA